MADLGFWPSFPFAQGETIQQSSPASWFNGVTALTIISLHQTSSLDGTSELVNVSSGTLTQISLRLGTTGRYVAEQRWNNTARISQSATNVAVTSIQAVGVAFAAGALPAWAVDGLPSSPSVVPGVPAGTLASTNPLEYGRGDRGTYTGWNGDGGFLAFCDQALPVVQMAAMTDALLNARNVYDLGVAEFASPNVSWTSTNTAAQAFLLELRPFDFTTKGGGVLTATPALGGRGTKAAASDALTLATTVEIGGVGAGAGRGGGALVVPVALGGRGLKTGVGIGGGELSVAVNLDGLGRKAAKSGGVLSATLALGGVGVNVLVEPEPEPEPIGAFSRMFRATKVDPKDLAAPVFRGDAITARYEVRFDMGGGSYWIVTDDVRAISISRALNTWPGNVEAGICDVLLDDAFGIYSPLQTAVHNGNLHPNLPIDILATLTHEDNIEVSSYYLFRGLVDGISVEPFPEGLVSITARDLWKNLQMREVSTAMMVETNVSSILAIAFTAASIGVSQRSVDAISDILPFAWFRHRNLATVLNEFVEGSGYGAYVAANGIVRVRDRYFDVGRVVTVSYDTFTSLTWSMNDAELVNRMSVIGEPRFHIPSQQVVSSLGTTLQVPGNTSIEFWLDYQDPRGQGAAPAINMLTVPVSSRDFLFTTTSAETGTPLMSTASLRVTALGDAAKVQLYNGNAALGYINRLHLRGEPVVSIPNIAFVADNEDSQTIYGVRDASLTTRLFTNAEQLERRAIDVVELFDEPLPTVQMSQTDSFPQNMLLDLTDVVSITNSHTGIVNEFFTIFGLDHEIRADDVGMVHVVSYTLRRSRSLGAFILDTDQLDIDRIGR
jgi:hypothetical protein